MRHGVGLRVGQAWGRRGAGRGVRAPLGRRELGQPPWPPWPPGPCWSLSSPSCVMWSPPPYTPLPALLPSQLPLLLPSSPCRLPSASMRAEAGLGPCFCPSWFSSLRRRRCVSAPDDHRSPFLEGVCRVARNGVWCLLSQAAGLRSNPAGPFDSYASVAQLGQFVQRPRWRRSARAIATCRIHVGGCSSCTVLSPLATPQAGSQSDHPDRIGAPYRVYRV